MPHLVRYAIIVVVLILTQMPDPGRYKNMINNKTLSFTAKDFPDLVAELFDEEQAIFDESSDAETRYKKMKEAIKQKKMERDSRRSAITGPSKEAWGAKLDTHEDEFNKLYRRVLEKCRAPEFPIVTRVMDDPEKFLSILNLNNGNKAVEKG